MNPLMLRILLGDEDTRLEEHITMLEAHKSHATASAGFADGEQRLLDVLYARLEEITRP